MNIHFFKYQGTGNDFVILDNRDGRYTGLTEEQIKGLCDRRFGVGGDGLMMLQVQEGYDFAMQYYNSDGRPGSMCGNGGRCLTAFAWKMGIHQEHIHFIASDGPHEATLEGEDWVNLRMKNVDSVETDPAFFYLNTGSPHYVQYVSQLSGFEVYEKGRSIRYNERFKAVGTNVNFVEPMPAENGIFVRTYERGVEDETYSCGTGVTAAALTYAGPEARTYTIPVKTLGGNLVVKFNKTGPHTYEDIWLCGPAKLVFEGNIALD
ncbi:diaminopimelate epimerase [Chitinophaga costaii]|uniref:Diaminopimelate epimerase n=1 Tax=Chitinophaga costaii TaxID=1335309 RepID=A0A1C4EDB2_9BACT|nr:diaminopimelate epimerase [Chitinophaga costaii]PUZ23898.1 diaminopimelate epimerase [Chitinophaga costaii]SCC41531.1 diaminopimelate epimerase [Chitinophaga costaii]